MSSKQDAKAAAEKGFFQRFVIAALLAAMLAAGSSGAGVVGAARGKTAAGLAALGGEGSALVQRVSMAAALYQKSLEERHLVLLKDAAATANSLYERIAPRLPPDSFALKEFKAYIEHAFAFARTPISPDGANEAQIMAAAAQNSLHTLWNGEIGSQVAALNREADTMVAASLVLLALALACLGYLAFGVAAQGLRQMQNLRAELGRMAAADALTGNYNRAMLFRVANMLISSARRHGQPLTALAIDIDDLGKINEKYGRAGGDAAIRAVAATIGSTLRSSDALGRVGGTEFGIFLPSTDEYHAGYAAEKLRAAVQDAPFAVGQSNVLLRVSVGVAEMKEGYKTPDDMLRAAETALKAAKDGGKNRVVSFGALKDAGAPPAALP